MSRLSLLILFFLFLSSPSFAQLPDTTTKPAIDSLHVQGPIAKPDTMMRVPVMDSFSKRPPDSSGRVDPAISIMSPLFMRKIMEHHPYFGFSTIPEILPASDLRVVNGKELLFYVLVVLLAIFGALKRAFPKYYGDLFRLFFRTTLKQRQIREQLIQTPLPSLLLNIFFVVTGALYLTFIIRYFELDTRLNFWVLFLYCGLGLSTAYLVKFVGLKLSGWLFNMRDAADSYIFIVFVVNKMIGIFLLPFLVLLAFTVGDIHTATVTLSWCTVAGLLAYRFILTYGAVRNQVKVNPFHFFLYLLAFEIAPLLLVYKGLLFYFRQTA